jgi:hypothetical protein
MRRSTVGPGTHRFADCGCGLVDLPFLEDTPANDRRSCGGVVRAAGSGSYAASATPLS